MAGETLIGFIGVDGPGCGSYVSLRLAQNSDHPLVVYEPMPVASHRKDHQQHHSNVKVAHPAAASSGPLQSDSLTRHNHTTTHAATTHAATLNGSSGSGGGLVTLHEAAVTLSVLEDTNDTSRPDETTTPPSPPSPNNSSLDDKNNGTNEEGEDTSPATIPSLPPPMPASTHHPAATPSPSAAHNNTTTNTHTPPTAKQKPANASTSQPATAAITTNPSLPHTHLHQNHQQPLWLPRTPSTSGGKNHLHQNTTTTIPAKSAAPSSTSTTSSTNTNTTTTTTTSSTHRPLAHKMVYMATTASGNRVGGFCVWKTDNVVSNWSYFFENIPIEYQSHQDTEDHEMRGMLAAVRTWAPLWDDHHVVLRSHHPVIKGSRHPTRRALGVELEKLSDDHFTYELEWRMKKTDRVVDISYCLSRLHRNFERWFHTSRPVLTNCSHPKTWNMTTKEQHRARVPQEAFVTPPSLETPILQ
ncbi:hypothetical protein Pmani_035860 [Petrolisthes manimaculis]|uniref:Uncharacterized protein n=1 Tax=Petrolisthes manimaculis TaxID=1843537 RepID=A0AAE1NLG7_9EUCA|nr:hypothetical protein Pmani_035860 [Petrolisthes manimaculis]